MKYHHRFRVKASLAEVASFHRSATSLGAITPPPIRVEVHAAPVELSAGEKMDFTLHLGPFQIPWLAIIENTTENGFTDRQIKGPYREWSHRHSFQPIEANITEIVDQVTAEVERPIGKRLFGWLMWIGMPFLFTYRSWKTRSLLERQL